MGEYETKLAAELARGGPLNDRMLATLRVLAEGPHTHPRLAERTGREKGNLLRPLQQVGFVHMDREQRPPVYSITAAGRAKLEAERVPVGTLSAQPAVQGTLTEDSESESESESELTVTPVNSTETGGAGDYSEGDVQQILVNRYEREPRARAECVRHYQPICAVCGFDFAAVYGAVMAGFIHVHHVRPLSTLGPNYQIDPIRDLRPVCPNCHAVAHHREPPYSLDEVREFIQRQTSGGE